MNLQMAARAFNSGNFRVAEQLCHQTLASEPSNAEAMNLMGALAGQAGRHDLAAEWMRKAIALQPRDAYYQRNYITALISLDRIDDAVQAVTQALRFVPQDPHLLTLQGVALCRQGDESAAAESLEQAISLDPNSSLAHFNLSEVYRRRQEEEKAIEHLRKAVDLDPNNADALNNMAGVLLDTGEFIEALRYLQRYLQVQPRSAQGYCNLSVAMSAAGDVQQSMVCLRNALRIDPSLKDPRYKLINMLTSTGDFKEAERMLDEWEQVEPGDGRLLSVRARMLEREGKVDQARETLDRVAEEDRDLIPVRVTNATLLDVEGKPAEAAEILEKVVAENEADAMDLVGIRFSLGKFYDQTGDYDKAFENFAVGNEKRAKGFGTPFVPEKSAANRDIVIKTLTEAWQKRTPGSGYESNVPIFILGMPRSGTSLTEQIFGAHSEVFTAGELQAFSKCVKATYETGQETTPQDGRFEIIENDVDGNQSPIIPKDFDAETLHEIGKSYVDHVLGLSGNATRVTDKMPYNFLFAPLIHMALPGAKIIHTRRHPLDTCVSCFFQNFTGGSEYAFNLEHLGIYYQNYLDLIGQWRDELQVPMLEVNYEDLVSDTEKTVRKMLEYCELEFEPACLDSHKNKRAVATASYQQVRQPIYQKSVARWEHYRKHIGPLIEALGTEK